MRSITLLLVAVLVLMLPPAALAQNDCGAEAQTFDVAGVMIYVVSGHDGETVIYMESNGQAGLQCKENPDTRVY